MRNTNRIINRITIKRALAAIAASALVATTIFGVIKSADASFFPSANSNYNLNYGLLGGYQQPYGYQFDPYNNNSYGYGNAYFPTGSYTDGYNSYYYPYDYLNNNYGYNGYGSYYPYSNSYYSYYPFSSPYGYGNTLFPYNSNRYGQYGYNCPLQFLQNSSTTGGNFFSAPCMY